ncbi:putative pentatricopeptide repeat-containing protein At5g09950 [Aristolochia californica]|uniref:putative pentatricopeptide repeat-containing protein At5g09950 n=1 Tax=Aristolochia californica TaxID=171875 RepID=UPI0035DA084E
MNRVLAPSNTFRQYSSPNDCLAAFSTLSSFVVSGWRGSNPNLRNPPSLSFQLQNLVEKYKQSLPSVDIPVLSPFPSPAETKFPNHADDSQSYFSTFEKLIHRYGSSSDTSDAQSLQTQLIKNGFTKDVFLCNTLINLLCKTGEMVLAQQIFEGMPEKNTVSWTCLMSGYVRRGMPDEASSLFCSMVREGFVPTHFSYGTALKACQDSGPCSLELGKQIHALISKTRYISDVVVGNALISMYGHCCISSPDNARRLFDGISTKNSISWNSIISVYSKIGDICSACDLFSEMQRDEFWTSIKPNEYTYGSLITATYSSYLLYPRSNLHLLKQMLSLIMKHGFLSDLYVGSAFVSAFSRLGLLDLARGIFEQMPNKNAVSLNGLLVGLVQQKRGEEALEVFRESRDLAGQNPDSYVVLLSACAEFTDKEEGRRKGREVHGYVVKNVLSNEKVAISNGLINVYAKCGYVDVACRVFKLMVVRDLISWNSLIAGLDQSGHFEEALDCFCDLKKNRFSPSNFALISTLSSCASLGWIRIGMQVHCEGIKLGLDLDVSVSNSLLKLYAESGFMSECCRLFYLMPEYDQVSWNSMIGALANSEGSILQAVETFSSMMQGGWSLNRVTFINILVAISSLSLLELGRQIHSLVIKYSLADDSAVENALLSCYAKCGEMSICELIFHRMSHRRDEVSWNSMVSGYVRNGLLEKAMDFLWYMMHNGQKMDAFTYATVLSACASIATLGCGTEVHAHGIRACLESDVVVESALVDMYSKCGRIDYASKVFGSMSSKNKFTWNSMISGYARHGHGEKALNVFKEMLEKDQKPDHVTFVGVLSACSHVGLVDQGLKYFDSMVKTYGLFPKLEHYSCMVDLLGRAGELDKMDEFIRMMPMTPNTLIWRTVIAACCRKSNRNSDLGKQAAKKLLELEPENPANYVLISHMHASAGRWEDVAKIRTLMRGEQVKKEAGCSWATLKDGVHVFVAGDRSHPESHKIYAKLKMLNEKMKSAGYIPQTKFALYDLEVENKEEILSYHSEKLAVAFLLIHTSGIPIRIMKNLRVCGDCHSALGYISKIVSRQIIVRDSNRFHHFEGGKCSCGDYW